MPNAISSSARKVLTTVPEFYPKRAARSGNLLLLWFGPGLLFVAGLLALVLYLRRRDRAIKDTPLTAEEQRRAEALLQDQDSRQGQP